MELKSDISDFNPFPGLKPYTPEDKELFFGRDAESDEIIQKLLKNRYITLVGSSGNGKSSLINCGIIPKINNLKIKQSSIWRTISLRPGNDPFGNAASAIANGITYPEQKSIDRDVILSELLNNPVSFSDVVRKYMVKSDDNIVLVIDQFEDLFRYSAVNPELNGATEKKFVDFILNSVITPDVNIFIIIAIRSEFLGECAHFKGLTMLVNNSNYLVPEMTIENYREVIEKPIINAGVKIEPELIDRLIKDISSYPFQLAVLQHAMMRIWHHWHGLGQPEKPVSVEDYALIGTMKNAISVHADEVYEELNQRDKDICSSIFRVLTRKDSDNKSLYHPTDIETLKTIAGCSAAELLNVIARFSNSPHLFLITFGQYSSNGNSVIDLPNECLIRYWSRLRNWIDDELASRETYLRLSEASALYQQGKSGLLRSPDLEPVIAWRKLNKPTLAWAVQYNPAFERAMVYLRTSEESYQIEEQNKIILQTRKIKQNRFITRILSIVILFTIGLILFAYVKKLTGEKKIILAEKQRSEAVRDKVLADSFAIIILKQKIISDSTAKASVKLAEEAQQQKITAEVRRSLAEKNSHEALLQKNRVLQQSDSVIKDGLVANQNAKKSKAELTESQRLRMLSIGKSMSLRSLQMNGQKDLQSLLAYQAYLINKKNRGAGNDADIYSGLYNVSLQNDNFNLNSFKGHNGDIKTIAFLPGKREFFTSGNDGQVLRWSLDKKDQALQVLYSGSDIIDVLAVSPDASWLACGSANSSIRMIPLKGNSIAFDMNGHRGGIKSLVFSFDGKYLYSAALDGKVLKWDIAARTNINVATGLMEITSIDISSGGNYLAGISKQGNVLVWNPDQNSDNFKIETTGKNIKVARFSPDNNLLALGEADGTVEIWDVNLRRKISEVKAHDGQINDIRFNNILRQMATSGNDKKLKIYNIIDPSDLTDPPVTLSDNQGFVLAIQFSPDGQMIVSGESGPGNNIISRPSHVDYMVQDICSLISRNMTQNEWNNYVAKDIPLEKTCNGNDLNIKIEQIKALRK